MAISEFTKRASGQAAPGSRPISSFTQNAVRASEVGIAKVPILSTKKTYQPVDFNKNKLRLDTPESGVVASQKTNAPVDFNKLSMPEVEVPKSPFLATVDRVIGKTITGSVLPNLPVSPIPKGVSEKVGEFTRKAATAIGQGFARSTAAAGAAIRGIPEQARALMTNTAVKPGTGEFQPEGKMQQAVYGTKDPISFRSTGAEWGLDPKGTAAPIIGLAGSMLDLSGTGATGKALRGLAGFKDSIAALRAVKSEGDALSVFAKMGVPEDLAKFFAQDAVKATTDDAASSLIDAIQTKMRTTKPSLFDTKPAIERVDKTGNTIRRNAANEVIEVVGNEGKVLYTADNLPKKSVEDAGKAFYEKQIRESMKSGKTINLDADELKASMKVREAADHAPYAQEVQKAYRQALKVKTKSPNVYITIGGPATGKTEVLGRRFANAGGIMLQGTGGNYARLIAHYKEAVAAGKKPIFVTRLKDPKDSWAFAKSREERGGHMTDEAYFIRRTNEAIANIKKAVNEGYRVGIIDDRKGVSDTVIFNKEKQLVILEELKYDLKHEDLGIGGGISRRGSQLTGDERGTYEGGERVRQADRGLPSRSSGRTVKDIPQLERMLKRVKESLAAAKANPEAHAKAYGGDRVPVYESKIKELNQRLSAARAERITAEGTEVDSLEDLATQHIGSEFVMGRSISEEERVVSNLESLFADMKGVDLEDLKQFSEEDLTKAKVQYEIVTDVLTDHPGRFWTKYRPPGKAWGDFTLAEIQASAMKRGGKAKDMDANLGIGQGLDDAQRDLDAYLSLRKQAASVFSEMRTISKNIRLAKQKDAFVGKEKMRLVREVARNIDGLRALAESAERAGYKKGLAAGSVKYKDLIARLKERRIKLTQIKKKYNLTDTQMRKARGPKDPRFMTTEEFGKYLEETRSKAELEFKRDQEKLFIEDTIEKSHLNKTENLQRALEFPPVKDMTLEQLGEFGAILSKTQPYDTFLGSRMIQTAKNTDLGNIRTIGEGRDAIAKQSGMPYNEGVEGSKTDRWLRDATLVERDPLHKLFITEWAAKEADLLTRKYALQNHLTKLASAARAARRKAGGRSWRQKIFGALTPEDDRIVKWLQPFETTYIDKIVNGKTVSKKVVIVQPELRAQIQAIMTPEEIKYAQFLEKFFSHYYNVAAQEATARWTLQGVKHSNYRSKRIESVYLPHMKRGFLERWRDDGFVKALGIMWDRHLADSTIDFNAFGDRGEVLGYEKWLKNNMERQGEGVEKATGKLFYTQNTAKIALSYFHGFERKLVIDAMTPKIKLLEFLMGKRFETPKSISNPAGSEQVHSQLSKHINEWINNKKGQRIEMAYAQGDRAEAVVDAARLFIAVQHLGANIFAQVISGAGGEVITFSGAGVKGWLKGHGRAVTKQGRKIGREYSGVIGDNPWNELASAANDVGDTLRSGLFYIFGDLAFRARRQMLLGLMTKEEFAAGTLSGKRAAELKLKIGKWHQLPEFRSIAGSTSAVKAAGMYTEWAMPVLQNTYFVTLPRLRNMVRSTDPEKWKTLAKSEEFQSLFRSVVAGAGLTAAAYLVLNPDQDDSSTAGYMRRKAAQEIGSTIQAITLWGIPTPFAIMNGYVDSIRTALQLMLTMERYETSGPGHKEGDLKGPPALGRAFIPRGIRQWIPEGETPLKTEEDIREEIRNGVKSGQLDVPAAKLKLQKELKSLKEKQKQQRFEMSDDEYRTDLRTRIQNKEVSPEEAKKEVAEYLEDRKKKDPERFESDSDDSFIDKVKVYAEAVGTDPVTAFNRIFTGQVIRRTDNGAIIVRRMSYEDSQSVKRDRGATKDLILDHTIPLQLGGSNVGSNLKLVPKGEWERFTPIENYLGQALRNEEIDEKTALRLIREFKAGKIDEKGVYAEVDRPTR